GLHVGGEEMERRGGADHAGHHPVDQLDDMHRLAGGPGDRREFEADKPGADHDDALGEGEALAQMIRLGEVAQVADPVELDPRQRRHPVARAGGDDEVVVAERRADAELDLPRGAVDLDGAGAAHVFDALFGVEALGTHQQEVEADLAAEVILGQRRPLIGKPRLVADQHHLAVETALAQRRGELEPAMPRAEDHHPHQVCVSGIVTTSPSMPGSMTSWHERRLLGWRGTAVPSSIASSPNSISGVFASWSSRTKT